MTYDQPELFRIPVKLEQDNGRSITIHYTELQNSAVMEVVIGNQRILFPLTENETLDVAQALMTRLYYHWEYGG